MKAHTITNWIKNNPVETWLIIGLVVIFSGIAVVAVASATGYLPTLPVPQLPTTGVAPTVLVHATPGLR